MENNEKQQYINLLREAINDGELSEATHLDETIYMIDSLKISGEFDYGIRGLDHNSLIFEDYSWADILQWGTLVVPETTSYISDLPISELENIGYHNIPLVDNHKYKIQDSKELLTKRPALNKFEQRLNQAKLDKQSSTSSGIPYEPSKTRSR